MCKYYNKDGLCYELVELASHLTKSNCGDNSVSELIAILHSKDLNLAEISLKTGFATEHILQFDKESSNESLFTVWVGGAEVNDHILSLNDAFVLCSTWQDEGYKDAVIAEYYTQKKALRVLEDELQEEYDTSSSRVEHDGEDPESDVEVQKTFKLLTTVQDKLFLC